MKRTSADKKLRSVSRVESKARATPEEPYYIFVPLIYHHHIPPSLSLS